MSSSTGQGLLQTLQWCVGVGGMERGVLAPVMGLGFRPPPQAPRSQLACLPEAGPILAGSEGTKMSLPLSICTCCSFGGTVLLSLVILQVSGLLSLPADVSLSALTSQGRARQPSLAPGDVLRGTLPGCQ